MIYLLFILLCFLNLADAYTTYMSITTGVGKEGNPVMAWLFDKIGIIPGLALSKILLLGCLWPLQYHPAGPYVIGLVCCIYIAIVLNNLSVIVKLKYPKA